MPVLLKNTEPHVYEYQDPEGDDRLYSWLPIPAEGPVLFFARTGCVDALDQIGVPAVAGVYGAPPKYLDLRPLNGRSVVIWPINEKKGIRFAKKIAARLLQRNCRVQMIDPTTLGLEECEDAVEWLEKRSHLTKEEVQMEIAQLVSSAPEILS
jgi:hypothetical protein